MPFLQPHQSASIKSKLTSDLSTLGKLYKAKKSEYLTQNVNINLVEDLLELGWEEFGNPLKTKARLRKLKSHSIRFEDEVWCQFYELGYRTMNFDENFILPFGKHPEETKQIDVVAIDEETVFLIECRSSEILKKAPSWKDELESLSLRISGFKKSMDQLLGQGKKLKYIFATRNFRTNEDNSDLLRLARTNSYYYNDNTYQYINGLIRNYKSAAKYQFLGLVFKNQLINTDKVELPCIRGDMGGKAYYMFSIEPQTLLKMSFILHRTRANESEMPTYQRLLVPNRLKGITKFIDSGGYFPNSIIVNFITKKHKIVFLPHSKTKSTSAKTGTLLLPHAYAIAYIIDGQHRLYGYANSKYVKNNTIPVVAFTDLNSVEQLEIFMDINQNQKAVSPSLRLTLEEDLFWDSDRADQRLKALRSSIIQNLCNSLSSPLYNKIAVGEDSGDLSFKPFASALNKSGLIPTARGNNYHINTAQYSLYNIGRQNHNSEMELAKKRVVTLVSKCYEFVEENYPSIYNRDQSFIMSNRGTFAFICFIGSINQFISERHDLVPNTKIEDRFIFMKPYVSALLEGLNSLTKEEEDSTLSIYGSGADVRWFRSFQLIVNSKFPDYEPPELIDWKERQDEELQNEGRKYGVSIERYMKNTVISNMKILYKEDWELEINSIKRECLKRAEEENEKNYKEGLRKDRAIWTDMFTIMDYKKIISDYWTKMPNDKNIDFTNFQDTFTVDLGEGTKSKSDAMRWISYFNSYRNLWAHEGTKQKRLNRTEVDFLRKVYQFFYKGTDDK